MCTSVQASGNNLYMYFISYGKILHWYRFSILNINLRQITAVPIHYVYSETSGVFISNMDIYYLGKLNQDSFGLW